MWTTEPEYFSNTSIVVCSVAPSLSGRCATGRGSYEVYVPLDLRCCTTVKTSAPATSRSNTASTLVMCDSRTGVDSRFTGYTDCDMAPCDR